ncbi:MAG: DUF4178 domain-containing protein [Actinomycetota bacterium]|nr:DUF4178 domain-containing protein [Actinomycetota bacterium]
MDGLLAVVLIAVLALLAVVVVVAIRRSRPAPSRTRDTPQDPLAGHEGVTDVRTLRAGDMVDYRGTLYFVRGSLRLTEGGFSWDEHFLDDARGARCWISVEADPDVEVVLWNEREVPGEPGTKRMEVDGVSYRLDERGTARYRSEGTTSVAEQGTVEYVDYTGDGDRSLSFERFDGGPWEAGTGEAVVLSALRVYPAGSTRE